MIEIQLTRGFTTVIDDEDADLANYKWQAQVNVNNVHATRKIYDGCGNQKVLWLHRVILSRKLNRILLSKEECDHIDLKGTNNTRKNLRLASHCENIRNHGIRSDNTVGFKGVKRIGSGKFQARITENGNRHHLGTFLTSEEAHEAYKQAATKYHGKFARFE